MVDECLGESSEKLDVVGSETLSHLIKIGRVVRLLGGLGIIGVLVALVTDIIAMMLRPNYNPFIDSVSSLAIGPMGWIQDISFYSFSLGVMGLALGIYYGLGGTQKVKFGAWFLSAVGLGFIIVALFHADPRGEPRTIAGLIHGISTFSAVAFFVVACLLIGLGLRKEHRNPSVYTVLVAVAAMLVFVGDRLPSQWVWVGLRERIGGANAVVWVIVMCLTLMRGQTKNRAQPQKKEAARLECSTETLSQKSETEDVLRER
jgi:hypothetical membrane protein